MKRLEAPSKRKRTIEEEFVIFQRLLEKLFIQIQKESLSFVSDSADGSRIESLKMEFRSIQESIISTASNAFEQGDQISIISERIERVINRRDYRAGLPQDELKLERMKIFDDCVGPLLASQERSKEHADLVSKIGNDNIKIEVSGFPGLPAVFACLLYTSPSPRDRG